MLNLIITNFKRIPGISRIESKIGISLPVLATFFRQFKNPHVFLKALKKKGKGTVVLCTRNGLKIMIRKNIWDARIVREIFIDRRYVRYCKLPKNPIIVDIGGYIGDFSLFAAKYLSASRVVVYEPTIENFKILERNIAINKLQDRIIAVNKAVTNNNNKVNLNVQIKESEEVHVSAYFHNQEESRVVSSVTIDRLMEEHRLDSIDLLKVDCEGCEFDIFLGMEPESFSKIKNIVFEFHHIDDYSEKLSIIMDKLRSNGFKVQVHKPIAYGYKL
jgi:FkbM family methyltransferase